MRGADRQILSADCGNHEALRKFVMQKAIKDLFELSTQFHSPDLP
jgi:hypothetical protein